MAATDFRLGLTTGIKLNHCKTVVSGIMEHHFIFVAGLHRSGTSMLHQILRSHPSVSGFFDTGVPEDEGQHLQTVFRPAMAFGGPGRFGFDPNSYMDEHHRLATPKNAKRLFRQWSRHWDLSKEHLIEKSPPNIVRTRFLQRLFENSSFVVMLRHPIAVAYATQKWTQIPVALLLDHTLVCYERFHRDISLLRRVLVLRYEEFVETASAQVKRTTEFLGISPFEFPQQVRSGVNNEYFAMWRAGIDANTRRATREIEELAELFSMRAAAFGYRMHDPETLDALSWANSQSC